MPVFCGELKFVVVCCCWLIRLVADFGHTLSRGRGKQKPAPINFAFLLICKRLDYPEADTVGLLLGPSDERLMSLCGMLAVVVVFLQSTSSPWCGFRKHVRERELN